MSFAKDSKLQIIEKDIEDADCGLAFLSGLIHASGTITKNNEGMRLDIITDFKEIFSFVNKIINKLYGRNLSLEISDDYIINKTTYYRIKFPIDISIQILKDCSLVPPNGEIVFLSDTAINKIIDVTGQGLNKSRCHD